MIQRDKLLAMTGLLMAASNILQYFSYIRPLFISQLPQLLRLVMEILLVLIQSKDFFVSFYKYLEFASSLL